METTETKPETFTITANYDYKIKLKDRFKILFGGKLSAEIKIGVTEKPEVISNSCNLIFK